MAMILERQPTTTSKAAAIQSWNVILQTYQMAYRRSVSTPGKGGNRGGGSGAVVAGCAVVAADTQSRSQSILLVLSVKAPPRKTISTRRARSQAIGTPGDRALDNVDPGDVLP